eukprot:PITA_10143
MSTIIQTESCTFKEVVKHQVWKDAMNKEYEPIMKNDVWDVVPRPKDKSVVTSKWLYKIKHGADGSVEKFKARFVARGFSQKEGVDYVDIFVLDDWKSGKSQGEIFLSQGNYIVKILERFGMVDCKSVTTLMELNFKKLCGSIVGPDLENPSEYRQLVEALMFLANSRLDICFAVNTLIQFMVEPHHIHWIAAKNLLRYHWGTITYRLRYTVGDVRLQGYSDADWAGSVVDCKSTSGCCFSQGSTSISWMSKKQKSVALSTAEAEYIVASMASCEVVWLRKLFSELFGQVLDTIVIFYDNQSGIRLS